MSEARIDVVIGSAQAQSGANALNRAVDGIRSNFIDLAAKAFVVDRAISQIWTHAKQGAQFEETMARLNRQAGAFHSNAQTIVQDMERVSQGTLGIDKAATMASRALAIGLNPDHIHTFVQAAGLLKDQMGTDLPTAFDHLTQAAITGRGAILANIGVYVDLDEEIKKLAVSTNRTTEQITRQEKAMLMTKAMVGQVAEAERKLTDGTVSDSVRLQQVEKRWADMWTGLAQGAKTAVIESIEALEKLEKYLKEHPGKFIPGFSLSNAPPRAPRQHNAQEHDDITARTRRANQAAFPHDQQQHDDIVERTRKANAGPPPPPTQLPTSLQGVQLDAERERRDKRIQGDLDRTKAGLDAAAQLFEMDAQRQLITQEDLVNAKGVFRLREVAAAGQALNRERQMEEQLHVQRVQIGFQSTEERIGEDERYRSKVDELNQSLLANAQAFAQASVLVTQEGELAKEEAVKRSAQRNVESWKSSFDIVEGRRRQDLEDAQTYYQGEFDMAVARFAGDQEMATKERQLLREQLAFKLRLTQEEVDRILFLRKAGDFDGVRQIAGRADPALGARAVEGIVESATAKDILAAERANGDFFAGWSRGLQKYAQDRDSAFGMSADMARRTAQAMEQGFQQFFFDGLEGKLNSFKDVLGGVLDFTKQILSQIAAQMVTAGIIKPGTDALKGLFGHGGGVDTGWLNNIGEAFGANYAYPMRDGGIMPIERYAAGGITSRPQLALFGEGSQPEAFVPLPDGRTIPVTIRSPNVAPQVSVPISIQIHNSAPNTDVTARRQQAPGGDKEEIQIFITQAVNKGFSEGRFDRAVGQRFRLSPGGG